MSSTSFVPIPDSQFGGAIAVYVFAFLSTLGLVSVAMRILWVAVRLWLRRGRAQPQEYVFFHTQLGQYAACLIVAMIFNTTAGMIGIPWLIHHGVTEGPICRAQAVIMQIGSWAAGYFTVTIAVHTFNSLVLKRRQSPVICRTVITMGWVLAVLTATLPFAIHLPDGYVYGADGISCGVRSVYPKLQFFFHLLPILLAAVLSSVLYSLIFLILRGTLDISRGVKLNLDPEDRWKNSQARCANYQIFIARVARSMLWYPVAYVALLVPYSIMRLLVISRIAISFEATVFAFVCWYTLGIVDVLLLYNTFRVLGPAFDAASASSGMESSVSVEKIVDKKVSFSEKDSSTWSEAVPQYRYADLPSPQQAGVPLRLSNRNSASSLRSLIPAINTNLQPGDRISSTESTLSIEGRPVLASDSDDRFLAVATPAASPFPVSPTWTDYSTQVPNVASPIAPHRRLGSLTAHPGLPASPRLASPSISRHGSLVRSAASSPVNYSRPRRQGSTGSQYSEFENPRDLSSPINRSQPSYPDPIYSRTPLYSPSRPSRPPRSPSSFRSPIISQQRPLILSPTNSVTSRNVGARF